MNYTDKYLADMVQSYLETILWAETDNADDSGGEPLDANYTVDDIDDESRARATEDCKRFLDGLPSSCEAYDAEDMGHDLWLTRNGHGAGFWGGDYPEPDATTLTDAAHAMGDRWAYVADDGTVEVS